MEQYMKQNVNIADQPNETAVYAVIGKKAEAEFRQTGKTDGGFAVLNKDKVTFGGKCFVKKGRDFDEQRANWTASVNEITCCTYTRNIRVIMIIFGALFAVLGVVFLPLVMGLAGSDLKDGGLLYLVVLDLGFFALSGFFVVRFIKSRRAFFEISMHSRSNFKRNLYKQRCFYKGANKVNCIA